MYHLNQVIVGGGSSSAVVSLVINVRLATISKSVKIENWELAWITIAQIITHVCVRNGNPQVSVKNINAVNQCTQEFVISWKGIKNVNLVQNVDICIHLTSKLRNLYTKFSYVKISNKCKSAKMEMHVNSLTV